MSRPMILMQEAKLKELYEKFSLGVPVLSIIRTYRMEGITTPPTLTKLLRHYHAYCTSSNNTVKNMIFNSLFPEWLTSDKNKLTSTTPKNYFYQGKMPLGIWRKRDEYVENKETKNQLPENPTTKANKAKTVKPKPRAKNGKVLPNKNK